MVISLKSIIALFRPARPTFAEALRRSGFKPAVVRRIKISERRKRETLQRRGQG